MTKNEILDLIDTLNQYKAGNVTNKGLEEAFGYEYGYVLSKEGEWLTFESKL
jgi:hypothetical protein